MVGTRLNFYAVEEKVSRASGLYPFFNQSFVVESNFLASLIFSHRANIVAMRFEEKGITREKVEVFLSLRFRIISIEKNVVGDFRST